MFVLPHPFGHRLVSSEAIHVRLISQEVMENVVTLTVVIHEQIAILVNVASGPRVGVSTDTLIHDVAVVVADDEVLVSGHFIPLLGWFFYCLNSTLTQPMMQELCSVST